MTHANKMRYLIIGDVHISSTNRLDDRIVVLNQIVDIAVEKEVDKAIWLGDLFDSRNPNPQETNALYDIVQKLIEARIEVILLVGNHDQSKDFSTLDVFKKLKIKGVKLVESNHVEDGVLYLGHFLVQELSLTSGFKLDGVITAQQLIDRFPEPQVYLLGDNHKPSEYETNGKTLYSLGSVDRCNFGERENKPRVLFIESKPTGNIESIPLKVRPMIQCNITTEDISSGMLFKMPNKFDTAIVKTVISGSEEELKKVDMQQVREFFKSAHSLAIQYDVIKKDIVRDLSVTEETTDEDALKSYLDKKRTDLDNQTKNLLYEKGKEVIQQVKEKK